MKTRRLVLAVLFPVLFACLLVTPGCGSISASVESISDSVNNAFESVSNSFNSSSGGGTASALNYQRDVTGYVVAWLAREPAERGDGDGELLRGVGVLASLHGISDWEAAPATRAALTEASDDPRLAEADRAWLRAELDRIETTR